MRAHLRRTPWCGHLTIGFFGNAGQAVLDWTVRRWVGPQRRLIGLHNRMGLQVLASGGPCLNLPREHRYGTRRSAGNVCLRDGINSHGAGGFLRARQRLWSSGTSRQAAWPNIGVTPSKARFYAGPMWAGNGGEADGLCGQATRRLRPSKDGDFGGLHPRKMREICGLDGFTRHPRVGACHRWRTA